MQGDLEALHGLGPYTVRRLAEVGIHTISELRAIGVVEAYARLKFHFDGEMSLNALWALEGALTATDWRHIPLERKRDLKAMLAKLASDRPGP